MLRNPHFHKNGLPLDDFGLKGKFKNPNAEMFHDTKFPEQLNMYQLLTV
jgi:hypothetical protein